MHKLKALIFLLLINNCGYDFSEFKKSTEKGTAANSDLVTGIFQDSCRIELRSQSIT